jgi:hypothetical protein
MKKTIVKCVAVATLLIIFFLVVPVRTKVLGMYCVAPPSVVNYHIIRGQYMSYNDLQEPYIPADINCAGSDIRFRLYLL